ncbi:zinc finger protein 570 isoform X2 [Oryzias latipes]|uniref:zinc finger protein 570 isoform X2 n=1 Tax=Oryzias latipes TaxID=8090 RepID=UPI000CE284C2|nr:zinc finger protein 570 isoform X2 [Oryzias latipes]
MPSRCVAAGCSNTSSESVSVYKFPKQETLLKQWTKQVQRTRANWVPTASSTLCSEHFEADCFEEKPQLMKDMGMHVRYKKVLKPNAIPTIFKRSLVGTSETETPSTSSGSSQYKKRKSVTEKLAQKREYMMNDSSNQERASSLDQAEPEPPQFKEEPEELCINQEEESLWLNQDADVNAELKSKCEENFRDCKRIMFQFKELSHYQYCLGIRNAETDLHKTDVQQQHLCEDENKWHLHKRERHSSLDQAEPEPLQIKEEPEKLCSNQEGEQLLLNQETDVKMEFKSDLLDHQHHQRKITMIPVIKLERIDPSEKNICKEETDDEQLLWKQERSSSLDEEKPELPLIKEEWEEVCIGEEGEELELKEETDDFMVTEDDQENMDSNPEPIENPVLEANSQFRNSDAVIVQLDSPSDSHVKESSAVLCQHSDSIHTSERPYSCNVCEKSYSQSSTSKAHMKTPTGKKPFSCKVCKKNFTQRKNVKLHMRTHTGERPYSCKVCEKSFTQNSSLNVHMRIHTGERPFTCEVCEKSFTKGSDLKTHMRTHTGERPFSCHICNKGFIHSGGLTLHMRTHTGERPFTCKLCQKGFMQSSALKAHMRTHTGERPFICKVCEKTFSQSTKLKAHIRTHTAEKLFPCDICKKVFVSLRNLTYHMRTHTGERPYSCKVCQKCFTRSSSLCAHMKTHTGERPRVVNQNTSVTLIV